MTSLCRTESRQFERAAGEASKMVTSLCRLQNLFSFCILTCKKAWFNSPIDATRLVYMAINRKISVWYAIMTVAMKNLLLTSAVPLSSCVVSIPSSQNVNICKLQNTFSCDTIIPVWIFKVRYGFPGALTAGQVVKFPFNLLPFKGLLIKPICPSFCPGLKCVGCSRTHLFVARALLKFSNDRLHILIKWQDGRKRQ